jgi:hypothetical protein
MKWLALSLLLCTPALADEAAMHAAFVEGDVSVTRAAARTAVKPGDALAPGDEIATGSDARLEIAFASGTILRVGENSKLTLGESVPQQKVSARLALGNVWARVHKLLSGETFHLETDNAVAGVRGTEFRIEVEQGKEDLLRVYEGAVQVDGKAGGWSHRVEPNMELRFGKEAKGPAKFDPASEAGHKFARWARERRNPEQEHRVVPKDEKDKRERKRQH